MMQADRSTLLDDALRLTHEMLARAGIPDWQMVIHLEVERRQLLERAFATSEPLSEDLAVKVRALLALDKRLLEISSDGRDHLAGELSQVNKGSRANHAYQANMR